MESPEKVTNKTPKKGHETEEPGYGLFTYLAPKWPLSLKGPNPSKTRPFPIKTRVIWVLGT